jgi:chorismate dehydratase
MCTKIAHIRYMHSTNKQDFMNKLTFVSMPEDIHPQKIQVGVVSYLNTRPLTYGLMHTPFSEEIELIYDTPSGLAQSMKNGKLDISLLPVAAIAELDQPKIITSYGIASENEVASVCIFSEVPIEQISTIYLDYQSRTSNMLARILLKEYWKINPEIKMATAGYESQIKASTGGLIIGDRALKHRSKFPYVYDLATAWKKMTGLPFVFAVWVTQQEQDASFLIRFNTALGEGMNHISVLVKEANFAEYPLETYYTKNISYPLTPDMRESIELFSQKMIGQNVGSGISFS